MILTAGQSVVINVKFAPSTSGSASGNVTITSNASNSTLTIPISGTGLTAGILSAAPSSLNFGNVTVGQNQSLSSTVTNTGGSSVTISQVATTGTGFTSTAISTPMTLAAGQSVVINVKFAPSTSGSASGNVTVTSNASNPTMTIALSGTGAAAAGQLAISPTTLALAVLRTARAEQLRATLAATGANVTVTAASTNNSVFSLGGLSLPATIAAGTSVPFTITFSPQTVGSVSATLTITSNAQPFNDDCNIGRNRYGSTESHSQPFVEREYLTEYIGIQHLPSRVHDLMWFLR